MKRIFFYITLFMLFIFTFGSPAIADTLPIKVTGLCYDNFSSLVSVSTLANPSENHIQNLKYIRLSNPNRIYFDINNSILIGEKQQILFEKSNIKEIKLAQFETNPYTVRTVITFEEDFDTSKIKLFAVGGNIIVKTENPQLKNDYFNTIYDETSEKTAYSGITASSKIIQKINVPVDKPQNASEETMRDIQNAFEESTLTNTDGKTYDSVISLDLSSKLKLRTKYYINQYIFKNDGLLVSGFGQITTAGMFYLNSPKRAVIDLPNTYLDKAVRNKEISLCLNNTCNDTAKIGQFDYNTARIVITSESAEKYIPVYAKDSQSLFLINADKLNHTTLENNISNLNQAFVKKLDSKTSEIILSFTAPVVHSIVRTDNNLSLFLFNVRGYNETELVKTISNTLFKQLSVSLLPQVGIKTSLKVNKKDIIKIDESVDGKALKITITKSAEEEKSTEKPSRKNHSKNAVKVIIDPGHGGSDYGAIREGINEKDITLDVAKRIEAILRSKGIKAALTREEDIFVSLEDRVSFSEEREPEIFVSVHVNSAVSTTPQGIETHWYHEYSTPLAETVHKHLMKEISEANDRGLFKSKFYVINHTTSPAILCEIGFLSNEDERNELITEKRKQKTAKAIANGIIEYLKEVK